MAYLYILKNSKGKYYVGITVLDPKDRLTRHNKGDVYSTKFGRPWKIVYSEKILNLKLARGKEKKIKSWKGGNAFKKFLSSAAGSANGRQTDSESVNLGSNPSPAAVERNKTYLAG